MRCYNVVSTEVRARWIPCPTTATRVPTKSSPRKILRWRSNSTTEDFIRRLRRRSDTTRPRRRQWPRPRASTAASRRSSPARRRWCTPARSTSIMDSARWPLAPFWTTTEASSRWTWQRQQRQRPQPGRSTSDTIDYDSALIVKPHCDKTRRNLQL